MKKNGLLIVAVVLISTLLGTTPTGFAQSTPGTVGPSNKTESWNFAVAADSRNCGDVVMPAIAAGAKRDGARFFWLLGDLRWIGDVDEDIQHESEHLAKPLTKAEYEDIAWDDFAESQMAPFRPLPFYLGIGNHETEEPKDHAAFLARFSAQLDIPKLREQRLRDDPNDRSPKTYYHWVEGPVDFINLDNATGYKFDADQLLWFEKVLRADSSNARIRTLVIGMHEALPESIERGHSMDQTPEGVETGTRVYNDLLKIQNESHKRVYVLAGHSHHFVDGVFNTEYWREHGGALPGWIAGTAGAVRYPLPKEASSARIAETNIYGYLLGTVHADGEIQFSFQHLSEPDVPPSVVKRFTPEFVHWCFAENSKAK